MRRSMILAGAIAGLALSPAAASAGTIAYEGDTLVVTAGPGEANRTAAATITVKR